MNKKIDLYIVVLGSVFSLLLLSISYLILDLYNKNFAYIKTNDSISKSIDSIVYIDEVLTMSARMASITGDKTWVERYNEFVPKLDEAISTSINIIPEIKVLMQKIDTANSALIDLETKAFELIDKNES